MSLEVFLALAVLMLICIGTYFVAGRIRVPYSVLLVIVGTLLVPLTRFTWLHFLKSFQLTPELLFFVFLPVLIFESAYNMNLREMTENLRAISWLAVASLMISAFFAAVGLRYCLGLVGLDVPFIVTLLFGALISATDPVAVLALFKEYGAPKRLSLLSPLESIAYHVGRALIHSRALERLEEFREQGSVAAEVRRRRGTWAARCRRTRWAWSGLPPRAVRLP